MLSVSAIIPTHRRPELLAQSIASVVAQRVGPRELIIVDDADDIDTRIVVATAARSAPFPIRYVSNREGGVCSSRNLGAGQASSEWLAFLDDDDVWHPDFMARLLDRAAGASIDLVISGLVRHETGQPPSLRAQPEGLTRDTILRHAASMTGSNFVISRRAFFSVAGFDSDIKVFNDWDLLVRLIDAGTRYAVIDAPLAEWRDHPGSRIATPSLRRADGIDRFLRRYTHRLSPAIRRNLVTTALGIRRAQTHSAGERLALTARLIGAHGGLETLRRSAAWFRRWRDGSLLSPTSIALAQRR